MDHIKDLSAFQGLILSADNYYSFAKLTSKGGNEEKVKYVLEKLSNFLQEKNYICENGVVEENIENYRKLALYLILNSDLPILEEMTEMEGLDMVIWMLPTVPPFLLCELLWGLHMGRFLCEAVAFCRPGLALQLGAAAAAHQRHLDPATELPRARRLAAALYRQLARLHFCARVDPALPAAALDAFRLCVDRFVAPPNAERLLRLSVDDRYRYSGRSLDGLLRLIEECLGHFSTKQEFEAEGFEDVYRATHGPDGIETETLDFNICDSPNVAILQCLDKCHTVLLDGCTALVMNISVDIFCAWSEYEESGTSMQQSIGELCFRVRRMLGSTAAGAEHALAGMLQQLAREPPARGPGAPAAAAAPVAELLARAAGAGEAAAAWRAALLPRADLARHPALLRLLESYLSEFNDEQSYELFKKITEQVPNDQENKEYLKALAVKVFHRCNVRDKYTIISEQFRDCFHDDMESGDFNDTVTEIFNRLTASPDGDPSDVLTAFLQNPKRVFVKIFKSAAENAQQADIMLTVMDGLREYCDRRYRRDTEPAVVEAAHHALDNCLDTERKRDSFVNFMCSLKRRDIILENKMLVLVVMPQLHRALLARDVAGLGAGARLLAAAHGAPGLRAARAPALALLARLADALRWPAAPAAAFHPDQPHALDLVLKLTREIFDTYGDEIPAKELSWLRGRLQGRPLHPLTRPHFRRVLAAPPPAAAALLQALDSLTAGEWEYPLYAVWRPRGEEALAAPAAALRGLAARGAAPARLLHALAGFVGHVAKKYYDDPPTDEQVVAAVGAVAGVVRLVRDARQARTLCAAAAALAAPLADPARGPGVLAAAAAAAAAAPPLAAALAPLLARRPDPADPADPADGLNNGDIGDDDYSIDHICNVGSD